MRRDEARSLILLLIESGVPIHPRQRDRLFEVAEVTDADAGFRADLRGAVTMRKIREEREARDRAELRDLAERFTRALGI